MCAYENVKHFAGCLCYRERRPFANTVTMPIKIKEPIKFLSPIPPFAQSIIQAIVLFYLDVYINYEEYIILNNHKILDVLFKKNYLLLIFFI